MMLNVAGVTICLFHSKSCDNGHEPALGAFKTNDEDICSGSVPPHRAPEGHRAHVPPTYALDDKLHCSLCPISFYVAPRCYWCCQGENRIKRFSYLINLISYVVLWEIE